ncbi:hypothetical protein BESB_003080 [Besnoitia besnoiti]|uniref:Uncharacterized protein n=1 Tax=Besnoitia besnoiti TaxID=94643 RepID=A0A2A9MPI9_BESBE|nr:hypothetical protein BESB_003080 [Besnoitia besnoiti]PFH37967.1 hypothetical protein BESB_003080 [Besnoitia besnoiti]
MEVDGVPCGAITARQTSKEVQGNPFGAASSGEKTRTAEDPAGASKAPAGAEERQKLPAGTASPGTSLTQLSFKDDLNSDWCLAVSRVDSGRMLLERLRAALLLWANAAVEQASKMENLVQTFVATNLESKTIMGAVNALRLECAHQADHCREFAEALRRDVVEGTLTNTIHNHYLVLQQIKADGAESQKELTLATVDHQKAMDRYLRCSKEAAAAALKAQAAESEAPSVRTELALSAIRRCVEAKAAEDEHRESVARLNAAAQSSERKMSIILQSLQDMDEKRMLCFRDALRKAMVYQAAYLRNLQYDLEQTIKTVDLVEPKADLQEFLGKHYLPRKSQAAGPVKAQSWVELETTFGDALLVSAPLSASSAAASPFASTSFSSSSLGAGASAGAEDAAETPPGCGRPPLSSGSVLAIATDEAAPRHETAAGDGRSKVRDARSASPVGAGESREGEEEALGKAERDCDTVLDLLWSAAELEESERRDRGREASQAAGEPSRDGSEALPPSAVVVDPAQCPYSAEVCAQLSAVLPQLKVDFASSAKRFAFLKSLERRRRACMVKGHKQVYLRHVVCLRILGQISEWLLDYADEQLDVWTGRMLLLLSMQIAASGLKSADPQMQTFAWPEFARAVEEERKKRGKAQGDAQRVADEGAGSADRETVRWSLHRCIYHHRYWNRVTFWEEALTLTISEELQRQKLMEKWRTMGDEVLQQEEQKFRERNPCCGCLTSFGSFMVLYGIAPEQVQSLLLSVCRACHLDDDFAARLVEGMKQFAAPAGAGGAPKPAALSSASSSSGALASSARSSQSRDSASGAAGEADRGVAASSSHAASEASPESAMAEESGAACAAFDRGENGKKREEDGRVAAAGEEPRRTRSLAGSAEEERAGAQAGA